jgi:hypothetical protein
LSSKHEALSSNLSTVRKKNLQKFLKFQSQMVRPAGMLVIFIQTLIYVGQAV